MSDRLRVLSWNLWWRFGPWEERLPAIVASIEQLDADLIALQEVWVADGTSSAHVVAEALGYHVEVAHRLELDGVGFGNAVVSRWPIARAAVRPLPSAGGTEEQRLALLAEVEAPNAPVQVISTHLNWRHDESAVRQAQVRELCAFIAAERPRSYPPVLCGDFNAEPDSDEMRFLRGLTDLDDRSTYYQDAWGQAGDGSGLTQDWRTHPISAAMNVPRKRIDYVLVGDPFQRQGDAGRVLSAERAFHEPMTGVQASDHAGLVVDIAWPDRPST
jgi:endonuclease/exonuclease/phosphatase family metal-dependent hydrolase